MRIGRAKLERETTQLYYLAHKNVKKLWIEKKNRKGIHPVHLETVEISPQICCFEWEGEQTLQVGDELNLRFDLKESTFNKRAAVLTVDRCLLLDEDFEHKTWHLYCAQFDVELDPDFFGEIVGPPRKCKSRF